jgi:hypothetical protein
MLKRVIGRTVSIDTFEKLTEYSIGERELTLLGSNLIEVKGTKWEELHQPGRIQVWQRLHDRIGAADILLLEYGVFRGNSMRMLLKLFTSPGSRFYGFDSFEGLPEDWRGAEPGHFSVGGQIPQIDDDRVGFVKGWFRDSLPGKLDELVEVAKNRTLIVHFDADLYSSTLYLLFRLTERFDHFYFVFDEFSGHEARALFNFRQAVGCEVEFFDHTLFKGWPAVVSGRLTLPPAN